MNKTRKWFTPEALYGTIRRVFTTSFYDNNTDYAISTPDCYMSGLAVFSLKYPSLLQFDNDRQTEAHVRINLKNLYGIEQAPCDTQMRTRLDKESVNPIHYAMRAIFRTLQRTKVLDNWRFLNEYCLLSVDATGFYSSNEIHCKHCCTKVHNRGKADEYTTYHHQMLVGSIVHPSLNCVLPVNFEPIERGDRDKKNDCEHTAGKRFLGSFRSAHPQLPTIFLGDGLYSDGPAVF